MKHSGTQTFETSRLICRRFSMLDYEDMYKNWASDPQIQLEYGEPVYSTIPEVKKLLNTYIDNTIKLRKNHEQNMNFTENLLTNQRSPDVQQGATKLTV